MMKPRPTMANVAKVAGVSPAVISYVLNGRAEEMRIPAVTRDRVLEACRSLNYRRDYVARAMSGRRTQVIGVLFCNSRGEFMTDILSGIYDVLRENDHQVALSIVDDNPAIEAAELLSLRDWRVDGVISFPVWQSHPSPHWNEAVAAGLPVMFLSIVPFGLKAPSIDIDDFQAGREAAQLADANGCRQVFLYEFPSAAPSLVAREAGFENECRMLGLRVIKIPVSEHGDELAAKLAAEKTPTATFVSRASDLVPPLRQIFGGGGAVDSRHVFVTVGTCAEAHFIPNPWFMLPHPARQMGRIAAMRILEGIRKKHFPVEKTVLPHNWTSNAAGKPMLHPSPDHFSAQHHSTQQNLTLT